MSTNFDPRATGPREPMSLQAVAQLAATHPDAVLVLDEGQFQVLGKGQFTGAHGSMSVAWVESGNDATGAFLAALAGAYTPGFASSIARELGLAPAPGRPLPAYAVTQALEKARVGAPLLDGVAFAQQLFGQPGGTSGPQA